MVWILAGLIVLLAAGVWSFHSVVSRHNTGTADRALEKIGASAESAGTAAQTPVVIPQSRPEEISSSNAEEGIGSSALLAFRYNKTQVFFPASADDASIEVNWDEMKNLTELGVPVAKNGPEGIWIADSKTVQDHEQLFQRAHAGEKWRLSVSPTLRITVIVKHPVVAEVVGNAIAGFIAEVVPADQPEFESCSQQYFVIQEPSDAQPSKETVSEVRELADWSLLPAVRPRLEELLNARMLKELAGMHHFTYMDESSDQKYPDLSPQFQQWRGFDKKLRSGEAKLKYDVRAFQLTPDKMPRLFIRASWSVDGQPVFLLSDWIRAEPASLFEEVADAGHSELLRTFDGYAPDYSAVGEILNIFDLSGNGHGQVLILETGWEGFGVSLLRYTETGPLPAHLSFGGSA